MTDVLISAGELADLVTKEPCVIIDTRNPDAYGAGHLPNAVNVHEIFTYLATSTPEGMEELKTKFADAFGKAGLSGNETAVIYEQSMNSGFGQSCRGYYLLTMLGYPKIKVVHGGYDA
jgi:thiosulfate/3-mercaptopyruvate sulfurtransferase